MITITVNIEYEDGSCTVDVSTQKTNLKRVGGLIETAMAETIMSGIQTGIQNMTDAATESGIPVETVDEAVDPFDEDEDDTERYEKEYCDGCGRPSEAITSGLCPMCFELNGGVI